MPTGYCFRILWKKISYEDLFVRIDNTARAFLDIGVKAGDIVPIMAVSIPEVIYSIYGLNKIGAIPNMIDPRTGGAGLKAYLTETDSKYLVALDICHVAVREALSTGSLKKVIELSAADSLPFPLCQIMRYQNRHTIIKGNPDVLTWRQFVKAKKSGPIPVMKYKKDSPAIIVHTGGTTGTSKGVVLSNDNINAVAHQVKYTRFELVRRDRFLNVLVPFVAFGVTLGMHAPLSLGWHSILIPKFAPADMVSLMRKYKPAAVMGIATYFEPLLNEKDFDFSYCKAILMGGMPTKEAFEQEMNQCIANGNGNFMISKGYSMTEASSTATASQNGANEVGSNGIPLVNTVVAAFDPETGKELPYRELGELCILSPTRMVEYYGNPTETANVLRVHSDGNKWIHSGDIGYVTENGFVYVVDRIKRMIIRSGYKVFPTEIENVFLKHPAVRSCSVVSVDDETDDKAPYAYIVLDDDFQGDKCQVTCELKEYIVANGLPPYFAPVGYSFRNDLPLTPVGKVDYRALEKEAENL